MGNHLLGVSGSYPLLVDLWLLPLAGAVICWAFGPRLQSRAGWIVSALVGGAFVLALFSWHDATQSVGASVGAHQALVSWMPGFDFGLLLDPLSLLWTLVITGVGFLIIFYSNGYMEGDRAFARFFAYMSFFVFAMLTLVLSDNFVGLLVGWGLVGLASYFLIGFWFDRPSAVAAARKAFAPPSSINAARAKLATRGETKPGIAASRRAFFSRVVSSTRPGSLRTGAPLRPATRTALCSASSHRSASPIEL